MKKLSLSDKIQVALALGFIGFILFTTISAMVVMG